MVPSQPSPSSALREYCWVARTSPRSWSEVTVPVGESDGREICLPLEICCWIFCPRAAVRCRSLSALVVMLCSVTLVGIVMACPLGPSPADQAGAVDQLVEHRIDRGEHPRGRLVT